MSSTDNNTSQPKQGSNDEKPFPHRQVAVGISIAAVGYLLYSLTSTLISEWSKDLDNDIKEKQEKLRKLEEYKNDPELYRTQYIHPLNELQIDINHPNAGHHNYNGSSGPSTPTFDRMVGTDDFPEAPCTPPGNKGGISSRRSVLSQPPSPKTHGVLEKLDSLDGEKIWRQLDADGIGMISKQVVLEYISSLSDLQNFLSSIATSISTPTLQGSDPSEYKNALLSRAVDKLAGANREMISYERWKKYLKGGTTFDPIHIDGQIDGVD